MAVHGTPTLLLVKPLSQDDDSALADALLSRHPQAAQVAWTRFSPVAVRILRRYFGPGPDRQDLTQEVFLRFFARISELRNPAALRSFFIGICLGVAQNELRRVKVRRWISLTPTGDLPDVPLHNWDPEAREATARFYRILEGIGVEDRTLFVARYVEKMDIPEIAAALSRPRSTIKRRLARVTKRVGARMSGDPTLAGYVDGLIPRRVEKP
jgi:RNA polymerase sigma-70 factor (ECF subfamily)